MRPFLVVIMVLCGILVLAVISIPTTPPTNTPDPPAPKTRAQIEDDHYGVAEYMCERWTEANSKLEVDKVLGWNKLKKTKPGMYSVRIEYRAKPLGLIMLSDCTYQITAENAPIVFMRGFSRAE